MSISARAAEACKVNEPPLSVQIRKPERLLGVALFEPTDRAVMPTPACEQLIGLVRVAVAAIDAPVARNLRDPPGWGYLARRHPDGSALPPLVFPPPRERRPVLHQPEVFAQPGG
jgi:LysR family hydrogen peroxide-inducible transcriptional activator